MANIYKNRAKKQKHLAKGGRMKTIAIGTTKGGAGKTTLTTNLAIAAALRGHSVLIIDADPQGSSISFRSLRDNDLVSAAQITTPTLHKDLVKFSASIDICFIDIGAGHPKVFKSAIAAADLLVIPVLPSPYDLWATGNTIDILEDARSFDITTPARSVLNQTIKGTIMMKETREALEPIIAAAPLLNSQITHRQVFKNAVAAAQGVVEYDKQSPAVEEINNLLDEILNIIETNK